MARVTVEDCLKNVDNRFELVLVATKRARQIAKEGTDPLVPWDGDKPAVVALREIAENLLSPQGHKAAPVMQHEVVEQQQETTAAATDQTADDSSDSEAK